MCLHTCLTKVKNQISKQKVFICVINISTVTEKLRMRQILINLAAEIKSLNKFN